MAKLTYRSKTSGLVERSILQYMIRDASLNVSFMRLKVEIKIQIKVN